MFAKLLKHEWKRSAGILGVLTLAALGIGILGAIILRVLMSTGEQLGEESVGASILFAGMIAMLGFMLLALVVYAAASELLLLYRFYKSRFTDEGYLTFTLPVNSHQVFLSAMLNMLAWMVISVVTVFVAVSVAVLFGTATDALINTEIFEYLGYIVQVIREVFAYLSVMDLPVMIAYMVVTPVTSLMIAMSCITIGAVIAKKLKLLVAFGLYYAQSMVMGVVVSIAEVVLMLAQMDAETYSVSGVYLVQMVLQVGLAVGGYFLSTYLMRRKLNLP